jgi:hypothetical protein
MHMNTCQPASTGMSRQFTLTDHDVSVITQALEAIAGSTCGDLVPDAPRMIATDPTWWTAAVSLCERLDAALPPDRRDDPFWQTAELRDMLTRAARVPGDAGPAAAG